MYQRWCAMWRAAKAVADHVVLIGPGTAETWVLPPSWNSAADSCLSSLHHFGVYHFGLKRMWAALEQLPGDTYHAKASCRTAGEQVRYDKNVAVTYDVFFEEVKKKDGNEASKVNDFAVEAEASAAAVAAAMPPPPPPVPEGGFVSAPPVMPDDGFATAPLPPVRFGKYRDYNAPAPDDEDARKRKSESAPPGRNRRLDW